MRIFRDVARLVQPAELISRVRAHLRGGAVEVALVLAGTLEQGLADLAPRDDLGVVEKRARRVVTLLAARYLGAERRGPEPVDAYLDDLEALLPARPVRFKLPEGFVHYGLDPASYGESARRYLDGADGPDRVALVVGVRSVGTTLSAVVAAALGRVPSITVRPRGPVGRRAVAATERLELLVRRKAARDRDVLVVDEGPGATGETFASVAAWLRSLGVPDSRIVLFGSGDSGMPLCPESRRRWFERVRKVLPPRRDRRPEALGRALGMEVVADLSAGGWRSRLRGGAGLPARSFERLKHLLRDRRGELWVARYSGLAGADEEAVCRSARLARSRLVLAAARAGRGFVLQPWVAGRPVSAVELRRPDNLRQVGRYLAERARAGRTGLPAEGERLVESLLENAKEAFGEGAPGLAAAARRLEALPELEACHPDGRMGPPEWIATAGGLIKTDALDHGDDCRGAGPTLPGWDLAGAAVELGLSDRQLRDLVELSEPGSGQSRLASVVEACRPAYAALALGDALASAWEASGGPEREGLVGRVRAARRRLARELARAGSRGPSPAAAPGPVLSPGEPRASGGP